MVYRGKPGLGCALCRKKRLACDRRRPSCSQCLRAKQECFGYRDPSNLTIIDQSTEVRMKAASKRSTALALHPKKQKQVSSTITLLPPPVSVDDRAMSFMFKHYVGTVPGQGVLPYLPELLHKDPSPALQSTMKVVGIANMSMVPEFRRSARQEYSIALRAINEALRDPVAAKSDSTLAAVLLVSVYEMITCPAPRGMLGWTNHVQGAMKLLELRGEEQLNSPAGMHMFTTVRIQSTVSAIFSRMSNRNSPAMTVLSTISKFKRDKHTRPIEDFLDMLVNLNDLSIEIDDARRKHDSTESLGSFIGKALQLDADLRSWKFTLNPLWHYTVIDLRQHSDNGAYFPLYGDRYHIYNNINIAAFWNYYRQTRIIVNDMIRSMALRLWGVESTLESQQTVIRSVAIIQEMADDICASVRYHLAVSQTGYGGTIRLPWPLFVAGICAGAGSATREWIIQTLDSIGRTTCIQQAIGMSQLLKSGEETDLLPGSSGRDLELDQLY